MQNRVEQWFLRRAPPLTHARPGILWEPHMGDPLPQSIVDSDREGNGSVFLFADYVWHTPKVTPRYTKRACFVQKKW
jgi:hypothetical protein